MTEVVLPISVKGEYNNVQLKPKWNKTAMKFEGGVLPGQVVILKKLPNLSRGLEVLSNKYTNKDGSPVVSYTCKALDSNGVEVSFWLSEAEHPEFVAIPDEGSFSATTVKESIVNRMTGAEIPRYKLVLKALSE